MSQAGSYNKKFQKGLEDDAGTQVVPDLNGYVQLVGGTNITTTATPASYLITIDSTATAGTLSTDTSNFDHILSAADDTIQKALDTIDDLSLTADDATTAQASSANFTLAGGANISSTAAGSTLTMALTGTTDHAVQIGNATGSLTSLGIGLTGQVLKGNTAADPSWGAVDLTTDVTGLLPVGSGGTGVGSITAYSFIVGDGTNAVNELGPLTDGQLIIGSTGNTAVAAVPTNGNNISWTAGAGTLQADVTGCTQYALQVGDATTSLDSLAIGSANQVLQSNGAGSNPSWSTTTYPASSAIGDLLYASAANTLDTLSFDATATRYLANTGGAGTIPAWDQINLSNGVTNTLGVANGGTGLSTITDHSLVVGSGTGAVTELGVATNGQIPIGSTGADPVLATITSTDASVTITNGAGSIDLSVASAAASGVTTSTANFDHILSGTDTDVQTALETIDDLTINGDSGSAQASSGAFTIAGSGTISTSASGSTISISGGGIIWNEETTTSATMSVNNGYVANNAALVTLTLPDTAAVGDVVEVVGKGAGKFKIGQNAGETIYYGSSATTTGVGGSLEADDQYCSIKLVCITADTGWIIASSVGNFIVT